MTANPDDPTEQPSDPRRDRVNLLTAISAGNGSVLGTDDIWTGLDSAVLPVRNAWYPETRAETDLQGRARMPLNLPITIGAYYPMTEKQFRVLLMQPGGTLRHGRALSATAMCLWSTARSPEQITDTWMCQWGREVDEAHVQYLFPNSATGAMMRESGGYVSRAKVVTAAARRHGSTVLLRATWLMANLDELSEYPPDVAHEFVEHNLPDAAERTRALLDRLGTRVWREEKWPTV